MTHTLSRRDFAKVAGAAALGAAALVGGQPAQAGEFTGRIKKAVKYGMVSGDLTPTEKLQLLKDLGFDGVEPTVRELADVDAILEASKATGLPVHGVVNGSVENINHAVDLAKRLGATSVLVCAGGVNAKMPYAENYTITQAKIREAIPYAAQNEILLLVENVWNNFLLSPLEMARYIDELDSEWVGVYFDIGNVARFGWSEHWIPVLGKRIRKLDLKGYSRKKQNEAGPWKGFDVEIGDDEIDWAAVRAELKKIDYTGWATSEVAGGGRERLADVAARMDRVLDL